VLKGLWGNPWERNILLDIDIYGKGIIKWTFKSGKGACTGLIRLGICTGSGPL
jgi:hypothetical protein